MSNSTPSGFADTHPDADAGQFDASLPSCEQSPRLSLRTRLRSSVLSYLADEDGTTAVEYAVMVSLIAATCIAGFQSLTTATVESFQASSDELAASSE